MHQVAEVSLVLVFLIAGIQSRPLGKQSTTQQPPTPGCLSPRCLHESKCYEDGEEISRGTNGKGWCYGLLCSHGQSVAWDNFNCDRTTTTQPSPRSTHTPTTYPSTYPNTTPSGCYYNGAWYPPNSEISKGQDGRWCYGMYCSHDGQIIAWDDWDCGSSTTTTTAPPTPTPATPTQLGCLQNGIWYPAGSEISRGSDGQGWCYGEYCTFDGKLQLWDDFNCTTQPTTLPASQPKGCYYEGKWRSHGIFEDTDVRGCRYGAQCSSDGTVTRWEEFNCQL